MAAFELDYSRWSDATKQLIAATGRDATDLLRAESRLFCQDCAKLTPPTAKQPFTESLNAQRRQGEKAIATDIRKLFLDPLTLDFVKSHPKILQALTQYLNGTRLRSAAVSAAATPAARLLKSVQASATSPEACAITLLHRIGLKIPIVQQATAEYHARNRDPRGRVIGKRKVCVLQPKSIDKLIKDKQKLVGYAKSGWNFAASRLGLNLPAWITRHPGQGIYKEDRSQDGALQAITIGNTIPFIQRAGRDLRIMARALGRRTESMQHRLEKILERQFREH
jgi:hypothetical protein